MRILFVSEGDLGGIMGHAAVEETLRSSLAGVSGVDLRVASLTRLAGPVGLATRGLPPLSALDADLQAVRWHLVQSLRARRLVRRELAAFPADRLVVDSHAVALLLGDVMRRLPTFLSVDAPIWDFRSLGVWRRVLSHSRFALAPSLVLERRAFRRSAGVLAYTEWTKEAVEREQPGTRVVVRHPGVDVRLFRPQSRRPRKRPRILFVGSNFAKKGGEDLLAALDGRIGRDADLDLVTRGTVRAPAGARVHSLSVGDPGLVDLFRQADVFCLPTHADVAPLALLEAMACGAAVVSTPVSAIPELLDGGRAGALVPAGDVRALRVCLDRLLADEQLRAELGGRARARCEERYDSRGYAASLVEALELPQGEP